MPQKSTTDGSIQALSQLPGLLAAPNTAVSQLVPVVPRIPEWKQAVPAGLAPNSHPLKS
jgi:hypothetical protein